jgi:hypothetical protein
MVTGDLPISNLGRHSLDAPEYKEFISNRIVFPQIPSWDAKDIPFIAGPVNGMGSLKKYLL